MFFTIRGDLFLRKRIARLAIDRVNSQNVLSS